MQVSAIIQKLSGVAIQIRETLKSIKCGSPPRADLTTLPAHGRPHLATYPSCPTHSCKKVNDENVIVRLITVDNEVL